MWTSFRVNSLLKLNRCNLILTSSVWILFQVIFSSTVLIRLLLCLLWHLEVNDTHIYTENVRRNIPNTPVMSWPRWRSCALVKMLQSYGIECTCAYPDYWQDPRDKTTNVLQSTIYNRKNFDRRKVVWIIFLYLSILTFIIVHSYNRTARRTSRPTPIFGVASILTRQFATLLRGGKLITVNHCWIELRRVAPAKSSSWSMILKTKYWNLNCKK